MVWLIVVLPRMPVCYIKTSPMSAARLAACRLSKPKLTVRQTLPQTAPPRRPDMEKIAAYVRAQPRKKFTKDNILVYQGEAPRSLYAIRTGFVKIYDLSSDGNEQMVGLAGKYDFIPSELLFSRDVAAQ